MNHDVAIDVVNLTKSFQGEIAVNRVSLQIKRGEIFGFLGPNGSGKTTTIRMLCGLLTPDSGDGFCLGYNILTESFMIKRQVGYMTQQFSFYTDLSIEENLNFIAKIYGLSNVQKRVTAILHEYGLYSRRHQLTGTLSGGWKQRVALAACLLHEPKLLLLDEPTSGVDPIARRDFWDTIHELSEQGITTLISTHYMDEAERCSQLAYLAYGHLIVTGTVSDVIAKTHLKTWEVSGKVTPHLLQEIKKIPGVTQAMLFSEYIHVCGFEAAQIEGGLQALKSSYSIQWQSVHPTIEEAFISLVTGSSGERR